MAVLLGAAIVAVAMKLFSTSNLIFSDPRAALATPIASAVLGRNPIGTVLFIASTGLACVIVLWVRSHLARTGSPDMLTLYLAVMGLLLGALLPIQHGLFFADRHVRQLDRLPDGVSGMQPPVWIVERGAGDRVVLFGRDAAGASRLVTVKQEKTDGLAIIAVADFGDVLIQGPSP